METWCQCVTLNHALRPNSGSLLIDSSRLPLASFAGSLACDPQFDSPTLLRSQPIPKATKSVPHMYSYIRKCHSFMTSTCIHSKASTFEIDWEPKLKNVNNERNCVQQFLAFMVVWVCAMCCVCLRSVVVIDIAECMLYTVEHTLDVEYGCTKWPENDNDRLSLFSIKYIRQLLKISLHQMHTAHVPHFHLRTYSFASMPCHARHTHTHGHVAIAKNHLHNGITTYSTATCWRESTDKEKMTHERTGGPANSEKWQATLAMKSDRVNVFFVQRTRSVSKSLDKKIKLTHIFVDAAVIAVVVS